MNRNKITKNQKVQKLMKKGAAFGLCAMLAAGTLGGISTVNAEDAFLLKTEATDEKRERVVGYLDVSDIVEEAMPCVVSIATKSVMEVQNYYGMYGFGYGYLPEITEREVQGSGSGIIVGKNDTELLIATNYHVVEDAKTVTVTFADGESYETKGKGYDEDRDLAVVAVALEDITEDTMDAIKVAKIGSSDDLRVGEQVLAIGNALGYGQSVTTGIVSAKNRRLDDTYSSDDAVDLIQTDAAINPGNSGGALLNMNGEVVGINSAKMASTEVEGMGYAISISDVADVLEKLMNEVPRVKVEGNHGVLGITGSTVSEEARYYGIPEGVHVQEVTEGGAADKAGIRKNYIITEFDGKDINTINRLVELLEYYEPGEEVEVVVKYQNDGEYETKTVTVVLGEDTSKKEESSKKREEKNSEKDSDNKKEENKDDRRQPSYDDLEEFFFGNLFGDGWNRDEDKEYDDYGDEYDYDDNYDGDSDYEDEDDYAGDYWN